jgi:hypothetical protein
MTWAGHTIVFVVAFSTSFAISWWRCEREDKNRREGAGAPTG